MSFSRTSAANMARWTLRLLWGGSAKTTCPRQHTFTVAPRATMATASARITAHHAHSTHSASSSARLRQTRASRCRQQSIRPALCHAHGANRSCMMSPWQPPTTKTSTSASTRAPVTSLPFPRVRSSHRCAPQRPPPASKQASRSNRSTACSARYALPRALPTCRSRHLAGIADRASHWRRRLPWRISQSGDHMQQERVAGRPSRICSRHLLIGPCNL